MPKKNATKSQILLFKIHYFLWFSSLSGVLPYYVVFVRTYTEASASWIAILFAVLPFIAFFTNPVLCSLADKSSNHLKYLLLFTALTGFGYGSLLILPSIQSSLFSWLISLILLLIAYPSMATVTSLTDSIVMMMVTSDEPDCTERVKKPQFGQIRVWGTIGYGFFGFLSGPINSVNFGRSYLEMGFIMFIVILILDLTIVSVCARKWSILVMPASTGQTRIKGQNERKEEEEETNEKFISRKEQQETLNCQKNSQQHWSIFVSLFIHHPTIIQHTIILIGQGVLMACHWSYFYWFLELVSGRNTFLMGLTLLIGCFCGELIFFYYGNSIVNQIGSTNAFNISLAAFAVQYTVYAFLITPENQYLVCLTEILQGPTFGLFYTAMTHIGQEYADKQASILQSSKSGSTTANVTQIHATLQGFLSGCLEGLGLGLGSLGAGLLIDHYGVRIMWIIAASLAVFMLILNSSLQLIRAIMRKYKS